MPLTLLVPVFALQFHLPQGVMEVLPISLLMGTPVPSLIGGAGAGPKLGVRGAGVLPALRLYVPVLIFGASGEPVERIGAVLAAREVAGSMGASAALRIRCG